MSVSVEPTALLGSKGFVLGRPLSAASFYDFISTKQAFSDNCGIDTGLCRVTMF